LRSQRINTRLPLSSPRSETDFTVDPFPSKIGEWMWTCQLYTGC
jgi:hypothetical protein